MQQARLLRAAARPDRETPPLPSLSWWNAYLARHPEVSIRRAGEKTLARAAQEQPQVLRDWNTVF